MDEKDFSKQKQQGEEAKKIAKEVKESFEDLDKAARQALDHISDGFEKMIFEGGDFGDVLEGLKSQFLSLSQNYTQKAFNAGFDTLFDGFTGGGFDFGEISNSLTSFLSGKEKADSQQNGFSNFGYEGQASFQSLQGQPHQPSSKAPINVTIMARDLGSFQGSEQYISQSLARSVNRGQRNL